MTQSDVPEWRKFEEEKNKPEPELIFEEFEEEIDMTSIVATQKEPESEPKQIKAGPLDDVVASSYQYVETSSDKVL